MLKRKLPIVAFITVFTGILIAGLLGYNPLGAAVNNQDAPPAVVGEEAPDWEVDAWANLPDDTDTLDVGDYEGKTIYLYCFQSW